MMGGGQQQLQQISQELQAIEEEIEEVEAQVEARRDEKTEIDEAIDGIETLESGSMVQVPLGGGAYVRAEVQDIDQIIVGLGGGYSAEQDQDAAIAALERKKETIDERIEDLQEEISDLQNESTQLEQQAQQVQQQLQQQMAQQQQGLGGEDDDE